MTTELNEEPILAIKDRAYHRTKRKLEAVMAMLPHLWASGRYVDYERAVDDASRLYDEAMRAADQWFSESIDRLSALEPGGR